MNGQSGNTLGEKPVTRASIDIGTNTVLLLVADCTEGKMNIICEEQRVPRLGKGVDEGRNLNNGSIERVLKVIEEYRQILLKRYPEAGDPVVTATSAVRDANNRRVFLERVFRETGLQVAVLSGSQEARFTYAGALSVLPGIAGPVTVLDIGGGSTEVAIGQGLELTDCHSFDIGSVRFTERYLIDNPPDKNQIRRCRTAIKEEISKRPLRIPEDTVMVGVAGTATTLAFMESGLKEYDSSSLNGIQISLNQLNMWTEKVKKWSSHKLLQDYPEVMEGRADIFLAGLLILEGFMKIHRFDKLLVSTGGIRHGTILSAKI